MTEKTPQAALAEAYRYVLMERGRFSEIPPHIWKATVERLAAAGFAIVNEPMLAAAMQKHQDTNGRLEDHARYHCGGTCGYDLNRILASLAAPAAEPEGS
jgi:hypothetical protein